MHIELNSFLCPSVPEGNPVRIRNSTRCCKFYRPYDIGTESLSYKAIETIAVLRRRDIDRNESEYLPYNFYNTACGIIGFRLLMFQSELIQL